MAFYQCQNCKKVWQYPIEKCLDCFSELKKMPEGKVKVIGISKVTIPTIFHPQVPYFVLVLEDKNGNKWVQKSIKEYKIGDSWSLLDDKPPTAKSLNTVAIWKIKYDILEGIEKTLIVLENCTGQISAFPFMKSSKILILPTLISPKHPHFAENTSPQFLESLINYLLKIGAKIENIKVVGQSFDEIPIEISVQKSQLLKVCQHYKVLPLDLAKTNFVKKTEGKFTFEISEEVFHSDLIINLPILKVGKISATENILKFLKKENYLGLQYLFSKEKVIENFNKVLPPYLTLAEAQSVQKPDQFIVHLNLILTSFNPLNLDRVFAEICMVKDLPEFVKKVRMEEIPVVGRKIEEIQYQVEKF